MSWMELILNGALITIAMIVGGEDPIKKIHRVNVCLVASGSEGQGMTAQIWSDQIKQYFERYPGSYCGKCGKKRACPKD